MSKEQFIRSEAILGAEGQAALSKKTVAVFGVGGVGAACAEALARAGVGHLILVDGDKVQPSNLNRQLIALHSTVGIKKTEAASLRFKDINPDILLTLYSLFYDETTADAVDLSNCDYIIDAIDSVKSKVLLYRRAAELHVPVIASMGTGRKTDPALFRFDDLFHTSVCPLCRAMRGLCRKENIERLEVLYSTEPPVGVCLNEDGRLSPGSLSFVPPVAGMMLAGRVILRLAGYSDSAVSIARR